MSEVALIGIHGCFVESGSFDSHRFHLIIEHGGSAVGIDEGESFGCFTLSDGSQRQSGTLSVLRGRTDVEGIVSDGPPHDGPSFILMWFARENHCGGSLTQIQSCALQIEGLTGFIRYRLQRLESRDGEGVLRVSPTDDGIVVALGFEQSQGEDDGRYARDTGVADGDGCRGDAELVGNVLGSCTRIDGTLVCRLFCQQFDISLRRT